MFRLRIPGIPHTRGCDLPTVRDRKIRGNVRGMGRVRCGRWLRSIPPQRRRLGPGAAPRGQRVLDDAHEFVAWLSEKAGAEYRLLSEAEWEYVARAGSQTVYSWGNYVGVNRANCADVRDIGYGTCGDQWETTAQVGSFEPNEFGVHDVHGNVHEWVEDCWNESYAGAPSDGSAWRSGDCTRHLVRGGSWASDLRAVRSAYRGMRTSESRRPYIGFRVARMLMP